MTLEAMTDKELKVLYRQLGQNPRNYKRETLIERIIEAKEAKKPFFEGEVAKTQKPLPDPDKWEIEASADGFEVVTAPLRVSVIPDEPIQQPAVAMTQTLGMVAPVAAAPVYFGGLTQQQVLDATEKHRRQGMHVRFVDGCWEFWVTITGLNGAPRKGRMDSGNMALPLKVVLERADFVASGRPLPVVNPVIVPTASIAVAE